MSFVIKLYKYNSPNNYINKDLTEVGSYSGTLKAETSILDPEITIESTANLSQANYMYIAEFHRYYYIKKIDSVSNKLWKFSCHVDVLMTYKPKILDHSAIIARQEKLWNMYINDGNTFKVTNQPHIVQKTFPYGFTGQEFVMLVSGGV